MHHTVSERTTPLFVVVVVCLKINVDILSVDVISTERCPFVAFPHGVMSEKICITRSWDFHFLLNVVAQLVPNIAKSVSPEA